MRLYVKERVNVGAFDERDDYREATYAEYLELAKEMQHCGVLPCQHCGERGFHPGVPRPEIKPVGEAPPTPPEA